MTRTEAVEKIRRVLGFRTDLNDAILAELNDALVRLSLNATKPWFLIKENEPLTLVAEQATVDLPADFIEELEEEGVYVFSSEGEAQELVKNDADVLYSLYADASGLPEAYALVGNKLRLYPYPDEAYSATISYHCKDEALSTGGATNQYLTHVPELLIGMAGQVIAASVRDQAALKVFSSMEAQARTELYRQNESRKHSNASYQMGGSE